MRASKDHDVAADVLGAPVAAGEIVVCDHAEGFFEEMRKLVGKTLDNASIDSVYSN